MEFTAPLVPGQWQTPDRPTAHWIIAYWSRALGGPANFFLKWSVPAMRTLELGCYGATLLVEAYIRDEKGRVGFANALVGPGGFDPLVGEAATLHQLNAKLGVDLAAPEQAREYLLLFSNAIWAEGGRFQVVEDFNEIPFRAGAKVGDPILGQLLEHARPVVPIKEGGSWRASAAVVYKGNAFLADFQITQAGEVEMLMDSHIGEEDDLPVELERYADGIRWQEVFLEATG